MNYEAVRAEIVQHGFKRTHEAKKLEEFESPNGQVIYLYREQGLQGGVQIMVHPMLSGGLLQALPDVVLDPDFPLRSGSNMRRYPKRQSTGAAKPISFGRSMRAQTLDGLKRLLSAIVQTPAAAA